MILSINYPIVRNRTVCKMFKMLYYSVLYVLARNVIRRKYNSLRKVRILKYREFFDMK